MDRFIDLILLPDLCNKKHYNLISPFKMTQEVSASITKVDKMDLLPPWFNVSAAKFSNHQLCKAKI